MKSSQIQLEPAESADAAEITEVYLASRADALPGLPQPHTDDEIRAWIAGKVLRQYKVWVARQSGRIVGFLALDGDMIDQFYLLPDFYRQGIGSRLLAVARQYSPERLRLFTFQRNTRARAFYEVQGFRVVSLNDGSRNQEHEPDVEYLWIANPQLL